MALTNGISPSVLKDIRNAIPHGGIRDIHKKHTALMQSINEPVLEYQSIRAVIHGDWYRKDVIDVAIEYLQEMKAQSKTESKEASKKLKAALS